MAQFDAKLQLQPMPQLMEARGKDDDWTGITDRALRKKLQNRLNKRAANLLYWLSSLPLPPSKKNFSLGLETLRTYGSLIMEDPKPEEYRVDWNRRAPGFDRVIQDAWVQPSYPTLSTSKTSSPLFVRPALISLAPILLECGVLSYAKSRHMWPPAPTLPGDHLLTLVAFNVYRAVLINLSILSLLPAIPVECTASLEVRIPPVPATTPPGLVPTPLQRSTPHELFIDVFPHPAFRDNLIHARACGIIDEETFCDDLTGSLFEGLPEDSPDDKAPRVIVWRDPWDFAGWELTEGFVIKYGFLLHGCEELIEASNRWRAMRGEEPLIVVQHALRC